MIYAHFLSYIARNNGFLILMIFDILRTSSPRNALEKLRINLSNWIKNNGDGLKGKDAVQNGKNFVTVP